MIPRPPSSTLFPYTTLFRSSARASSSRPPWSASWRECTLGARSQREVTLVSIRRAIVAALTAALLAPAVVAAQSADDLKALRQEIESLKTGIGAVQRDLQEIKTLLQGARQAAGPPPPVVPESIDLSVADAYAKGGAGTRLVLVEFSDFQCPFCARHAKQTLPQIEREYVQTGKLLYVMRNLPLEAIHPDAFRAASAAECAGAQGNYWQMHEKLFGHRQALSAADLAR